MRKHKKRTLQQLIAENKQELLNDRQALEKIEERMERRAQKQSGIALHE
ncbi:FbpB family small basic protein [Bacillus solimangrovi]|nr:FbpB family small basic protein [Bacillus solimangrovi]